MENDHSDYLEHRDTSANSGPSDPSSPLKSEKESNDLSPTKKDEVSSLLKSEKESNDLSPTKEDEVNKNLSEATTLKKKDNTIQIEATNEDGKSVDKTDSVYLHKPPRDKQQPRVNQPENEGACMEFVYSSLMCLDSCIIL